MESGLYDFVKLNAVATAERQVHQTRCCFQDTQDLVAENLVEVQELRMANFDWLFRVTGLTLAGIALAAVGGSAVGVAIGRLRTPVLRRAGPPSIARATASANTEVS